MKRSTRTVETVTYSFSGEELLLAACRADGRGCPSPPPDDIQVTMLDPTVVAGEPIRAIIEIVASIGSKPGRRWLHVSADELIRTLIATFGWQLELGEERGFTVRSDPAGVFHIHTSWTIDETSDTFNLGGPQ